MLPSRAGDEIFDGCDVVVAQRMVNQRLAPCPLEVRAVAARWEPDGRLTQWSCTQGPHGTRNHLARVLGVEREMVRVITPDVGGAFGAKTGSYPEEVLVPWLARRLGRPVRWVETRSESMLGLGHGRNQIQTATLGGTRDGKLLAYRLNVIQDIGAYSSGATMLPWMTRLMAGGVYDIEKIDVDVVCVATNTTPSEAYRGAGRPEATAAIERMVDLFAAEIGMDPTEVRRRNFITPDKFPFTTRTRATYDSGEYEAALDRALSVAGYEQLRADQAARRERSDRVQLGIGCCVYVEITNPGAEDEYGSVEVLADGRAIARTGTSAHGQGHDTAFAMVVAAKTGIPFEQIEVRHGDTDDVPRGNGTGGSRSLQAGGSAIDGAAEILVARARDDAARLLEANPDDVVLDAATGRFHVAGTPSIFRTWTDLAQAEPMFARVRFRAARRDVPVRRAHRGRRGRHRNRRGAARASHRVRRRGDDREPDAVRRSGARRSRAGRRAGALRVVRVRRRGQPAYRELHRLRVPVGCGTAVASNASRWRPRRRSIRSARRASGEAGTIGATPAVHNAVIDALAPFGVTHLDMPCTPERVWRAVTGI